MTTTNLIVVKSQVKEVIRSYNISGDFVDVLDKKVKRLIEDAVERAEANGRKTVMGRDI